MSNRLHWIRWSFTLVIYERLKSKIKKATKASKKKKQILPLTCNHERVRFARHRRELKTLSELPFRYSARGAHNIVCK